MKFTGFIPNKCEFLTCPTNFENLDEGLALNSTETHVWQDCNLPIMDLIKMFYIPWHKKGMVLKFKNICDE